MLFETVTALAVAGRAALQALWPESPCAVSVSQLDQGQLAFPALAVLRINGHGLGYVQLGADGDLRQHLYTLADQDRRRAGGQVLAEDVLACLIEALPGRFVRGRVEHLALAPATRITRGVRTFGVRCRNEVGQLFLLAEVPSLTELERELDSDRLRRLADDCLPPDWSGQEEIGDAAASGLVDYLLASEADVHLRLPAPEGTFREKAAVLVGPVATADGACLRFGVPVDAVVRSRLGAGTPVRARVGVAGRSLEFQLPFVEFGVHELAAGFRLSGIICGPPRDLRVVQSRRSFRIPVPEGLEVLVEVADAGVPAVEARLVDLSFNGARLVHTLASREGALAPGDRVRCHFELPGRVESVMVSGQVRRAGRSFDELARPCVEIGVEFDDHADAPGDVDVIRQYVLDQQRDRLVRRIQVVGVGDW